MKFLVMRALPLGALIYSLSSHVEVVGKQVAFVKNAVNYVIVQTNMTKYALSIGGYISSTGAPPDDLEAYLDSSFRVMGGRASLDPWGRPFQIYQYYDGGEDTYYLVSCGPDGICENDDDIRVKIPLKSFQDF